MNIDACMQSESNEWETPSWLFDLLDGEFQFTLDAAATSSNTKCQHFIDEETDGLKIDWFGRVWLNPPYGSKIGLFVRKAYEQSQLNAEVVVCLIPTRTDTAYWHDYVMKASEIRLIRGRLQFIADIEGQKFKLNSAPFPSCVVVFLNGTYEPRISSLQKQGGNQIHDLNDDIITTEIDLTDDF